MQVAANASNKPFVPKDRFRGRLPIRLFMNCMPEWVVEDHNLIPVEGGCQYLGPFSMKPLPEVVEWIKKNLTGAFEIILWEDYLEAYWRAANDHEFENAWSVGFENENDALFFKMRWL